MAMLKQRSVKLLVCGAGMLTAAAVLAGPSVASAQVFAEAKKGLVDYTKADIPPRASCESLSTFKADGVTQIEARAVAAAAGVPAHCRVSGIISPEIAFEVNL